MDSDARLNIADRLRTSAERFPHRRAVVVADGVDAAGRVRYSHLTFEQLDRECDRLARGLVELGVAPGTRLVLMVRPGIEFIALVFALFRAGVVIVLVDPGMGRKHLVRCLERAEPEGFVAIPLAHVARLVYRRRFPKARFNVTVGRRGFWGGPTYRELLGEAWSPFEPPVIRATDPAAIIFTSGSTGPPKGVLYEHGMFDAQVDLLRDHYGIEPGEIDLPGFPLFGLFNAAMGVTTVVPEMDPTRPANVDPEKILRAIRDQGVTQAFGSPAMWNRIGRYCEEHEVRLPSLRRVLSAGAPVPNHVLRRITGTLRDADMHTPYGATESLPIASISGAEVLGETASMTAAGKGTCVGRPFPRIEVRVVAISETPFTSIDATSRLGPHEIGEILVKGPVVTRRYIDDEAATDLAKVPDDGDGFWHRMGDVGYLDDAGRLWFCGRKAHVVETESGPMFTIPCEAIVNEHPDVYRSALVGIGDKPRQTPVFVVEPEAGRFPSTPSDETRLRDEIRERARGNALTESVTTFLFHESLPVDTRHNVKINREALAEWAKTRV